MEQGTPFCEKVCTAMSEESEPRQPVIHSTRAKFNYGLKQFSTSGTLQIMGSESPWGPISVASDQGWKSCCSKHSQNISLKDNWCRSLCQEICFFLYSMCKVAKSKGEKKSEGDGRTGSLNSSRRNFQYNIKA